MGWSFLDRVRSKTFPFWVAWLFQLPILHALDGMSMLLTQQVEMEESIKDEILNPLTLYILSHFSSLHIQIMPVTGRVGDMITLTLRPTPIVLLLLPILSLTMSGYALASSAPLHQPRTLIPWAALVYTLMMSLLAWLLAPSFEQQQANTLLQLSVTHGPLGIAVHSYILALLFLTFGDGLQRGGGKPFQGLQVSLGAWAQSVKAVLITVSLGFLFSLLATFCFSLDQRYGKELLMAEGWDEGMRDPFPRFLQMQMGLYTYFLAHGNTMRACFCTEEETFLNTIQLWSQEGGWMLPCCLLSINVFVLARLRWPIPCESTSHWRMTGRFTGIYTLTVTALGLLAKSYFVISSAGEATHSLLTTQIGPSIPSLFVMAASISFFSVFIAGLILQVRGRRER